MKVRGDERIGERGAERGDERVYRVRGDQEGRGRSTVRGD